MKRIKRFYFIKQDKVSENKLYRKVVVFLLKAKKLKRCMVTSVPKSFDKRELLNYIFDHLAKNGLISKQAEFYSSMFPINYHPNQYNVVIEELL